MARDMIELIVKGRDAHKNVLAPIYKYDPELKIHREDPDKIPPDTIFKAVGYDEPKDRVEGESLANKHYRKYYRDELENDTRIIK